MNYVFATMAAMAALTISAPLSAQWGGNRTYSRDLQVQIDSGVRNGTISWREVRPLRDDLRRLVNLEQRYASNGISGREHSVLVRRTTSLNREIRLAVRSPNGDRRSAAWDNGDRGYGYHGRDERFEQPNRGDRFPGDLRVGNQVNWRMTEMPYQYREEYRDTQDVYYRYNDGRVYQVDRQSQLILALLDLAS